MGINQQQRLQITNEQGFLVALLMLMLVFVCFVFVLIFIFLNVLLHYSVVSFFVA